MRQRFTLRLPDDLVLAVDEHRQRLRDRAGIDASRTDAVVSMLRLSLNSLPRPDDRSGTSRQPEHVAG